MKTISISTVIASRAYAKSCLIILSILFSISVNAQKYQLKSGMYSQDSSAPFIFGVEGGVGTTQTKFKSDIVPLDGLKVLAKGWKTGIYFGSKGFLVGGGLGKYQFSPSADKHIDQTMLSGKVTVSPTSLFGNSRFFRPYILVGVDYNKYKIRGIAIPEPEPIKPAPGAGLACGCPGGGVPALPPPPPNPDSEISTESSTVQPENEVTTSTIKKAQINGGLGLELSVRMNGLLIKVFGEGYYGIPLKEKFANPGFAKTSLSSQMVINIGVGIGLTKKK
jgi:hypothetical protein